MTIHFTYKTTCIITGRFYIGVHSTENMDDRYFGSGLILKNSVRKYGRASHSRIVLDVFQDRKDAMAREFEIVDEELLSDPLCMNRRRGGSGTGNFGKCSPAALKSLISERTREAMARPEVIAKVRAYRLTPEQAAKHLAAQQARRVRERAVPGFKGMGLDDK